MERSNKTARKNLRLRAYDYSASGFYFVTICAYDGRCLFGEVNNGSMQLNRVGDYVTAQWLCLQNGCPHVTSHEFVVMPNHLHGIVELLIDDSGSREGVMNHAPTEDGFVHGGPVEAQLIAPSCNRPTLGEIIRGFKARCSVKLRKECGLALPIWQRNYYEHVIRNETSLLAIRQYVVNNPLQWHLDEENPKRVR